MPGGAGPLETGRVALIRYISPEGTACVGSGLLLNGHRVLTADHVADGDGHYVECHHGTRSVVAVLRSGTPAVDLAVLTLGEDVADFPQLEGARIDQDQISQVDGCVTVGFPRWRKDGDQRRSAQVNGRVPTAEGLESTADSGLRAGWLTLVGDRIPGAPKIPVGTLSETAPSPWGGMSGAVVMVGNLVVGVVRSHNLAAGGQSLTLTPLTAVDQLPEEVRQRFWDALGIDPARLAVLPDADAPATQKLTWGYLNQVRDLAPERLLDRDSELADMVRFCASDELYEWWQAGPWAGKSALAAWLVLHPPAGITAVSFFITSRWAGQADSEAFTVELLRQLSVVADEPGPSTLTPVDREKARRYLLNAAIERCVEMGQRLLLVVDGLDEDQGTIPGAVQLPSIASLLPYRPHPELRILVTSRPDPPLPADVLADHPLRSCKVRQLTASPHSQEIALLAQAELRQRRASGDAQVVDVLGYLTASGGGLTSSELAYLTHTPNWRLRDLFGSAFGRTLRRVATQDGDYVYMFAHGTLSQEADLLFQHDLPVYRERLHAWADEYSQRHWPAETPHYLLTSYGNMLARINDATRLVLLAVDIARQDRMFARDHNDGAALTEILSARRSVQAADSTALKELGVLAVAEWRLLYRNSKIPVDLPRVWAVLGDHDRAEQAARFFSNPGLQCQALIGVAGVVGETNPERARRLVSRAEQAARGIANPYDAVQALSEIAAAVRTIDPEHADKLFTESERLARTITDLHSQAVALANIATAVAATDPDRGRQLAADAEKTARTIDRYYYMRDALDEVSAHIVAAVPERGEEIARTVRDRQDREWALAGIAASQADANPDKAERAARGISNPDAAARALAGVAAAVARANLDRGLRLASDAEQTARLCTHPQALAAAFARIAATIATTDPDQARRLAAESEDIVRSIFDVRAQAQALIAIATALRALIAVDVNRVGRLVAYAEKASRAISDQSLRSVVVAHLASAQAFIDARIAGETARTISDRRLQVAVLAENNAVADSSHLEQAARMLPDPDLRAQALADLAIAVAETHPDRAVRLVSGAIREAESITGEYGQARTLASIAVVITNFDPERSRRLTNYAEEIGRTILDPDMQARAHAVIAASAAVASAHSDPERARELARDAEHAARVIPHPRQQARALLDVASVLAAIDPDSTEAMARTISEPHARAKAVPRIAANLAATDNQRARRILSDALSAESVFEALSSLSHVDAHVALRICEYALHCLASMTTSSLNAYPDYPTDA